MIWVNVNGENVFGCVAYKNIILYILMGSSYTMAVTKWEVAGHKVVGMAVHAGGSRVWKGEFHAHVHTSPFDAHAH